MLLSSNVPHSVDALEDSALYDIFSPRRCRWGSTCSRPPLKTEHRRVGAHPTHMPTERRDGIFPTFFLSGFECATFHWKQEGRRN